MIKIQISNSVSRIIGLNTKQFKSLRELLSYKIDSAASYFSSDKWGGKRYLLGKRGDFPTGLLYLVRFFLTKNAIGFTTVESRIKPVKPLQDVFKLSLPHTPYPEQIEAAKACRAAGRGIVCAPTGVGKSWMIALLVKELQVNTLIVVPSLALKRQLTADLKAAFGNVVGPYGHRIAVENVDALAPTVEDKMYHCVIIDEFHHSGASTYRKLNKKAWKHVYYKFGFTATPFRSQDHERLLLESVLSKVIYRVSYKTAVAKGYIVPLEAYYYELKPRVVDGYTWAQVYKELVVDNEERNALIIDTLKQLSEEGLSTICLVKEIAHGVKIKGNTALPFVKGENDDNREQLLAFNRRENRTMVATTGVMGEGVDTKPAEYIVIAGLGKSKPAFMQQVGRGFRRFEGKDSCKVILFYDKSHKWTSAHFKAQVKYLREEYGVKPVRLAVI